MINGQQERAAQRTGLARAGGAGRAARTITAIVAATLTAGPTAAAEAGGQPGADGIRSVQQALAQAAVSRTLRETGGDYEAAARTAIRVGLHDLANQMMTWHYQRQALELQNSLAASAARNAEPGGGSRTRGGGRRSTAAAGNTATAGRELHDLASRLAASAARNAERGGGSRTRGGGRRSTAAAGNTATAGRTRREENDRPDVERAAANREAIRIAGEVYDEASTGEAAWRVMMRAGIAQVDAGHADIGRATIEAAARMLIGQ